MNCRESLAVPRTGRPADRPPLLITGAAPWFSIILAGALAVGGASAAEIPDKLKMKPEQVFAFAQEPAVTRVGGNCLFSFEPATQKLVPLRISNWAKQVPGRDCQYKTVPLPENDKEPTPCDRHVYEGFAYAPDLEAVFIVICNDTWRFDLATNQWAQVKAANELPLGKSWDAQPLPLCYDVEHDCLLGMAGERFHAFRYAPGEDKP